MIPATYGDSLARTTLQVDEDTAGGSVVELIRALQRVPGVLLADVNDANARAVVAHDSAVSAMSLVAAARDAGVRVSVIDDTQAMPAVAVAAPPQWFSHRQLLITAMAAFIILTIFDTFVPNAARQHGVLIGLIAVLWGFVVAKSLMVRR